MNHNNAKERAESRPSTPFQLQSKHIDAVSHCIVFAELTLTVGNDGELNLYRLISNGELEHQATCKAFDCPIVAYDLIEEDNAWRIVLVGFDNRIAAITIKEKRSIIITHLFQFSKAEELSSCVWGRLPNQTVLGSSKGNISILNLDSAKVVQSYKLQEQQVKLLRCGREQVYLSTRNDISKLIFQQELQSIVILCQAFLGFRLQIQDFAISQKQLYNFLVILSKDVVYFFHLANLKLPPQQIQLAEKSQGGRMGWGKDYDSLAVYLPLRKGTAVEVFDCNIGGAWTKRKP